MPLLFICGFVQLVDHVFQFLVNGINLFVGVGFLLGGRFGFADRIKGPLPAKADHADIVGIGVTSFFGVTGKIFDGIIKTLPVNALDDIPVGQG